MDVEGCQSVEPGGICELKCKFPFEGEKKVGLCPHGNVDPNGLVLNESLPSCTVISRECDKVQPAEIPAPYQKLLTGWQCATGYTGYAIKSCVPSIGNCELSPILSGCSQLTPCEYVADDCRYNAYDCVSVQPGGTCQISCKAPYTGGIVMASCSSTNNDKNGLSLYEGMPTCNVMGCADPWPWPTGYVRTEDNGWQCDNGYTSNGAGVTKTCIPATDGGCSASSALSGCEPEEPCASLALPDQCWLNTTECGSVQAGERCKIRCRNGWQGVAGYGTCPAGNIDRSTPLRLKPPTCDCEDPWPVPPEYRWNNETKDWLCAEGFAGKAVKLCLPGVNCTTLPTLSGCSAPVPCDVAPWEDRGSSRDRLVGTLRFGPSRLGQEINESEVRSYEIYFGNNCSTMSLITEVRKSGRIHRCCKDSTYKVDIDVEPEIGASQLHIVATTSRGASPDAGIIELESVLGAFTITISFTFIVLGIAYEDLLNDASMREAFEAAMQRAIAEEGAHGLQPRHVALQLTPDQEIATSIHVSVRISPPFGTISADVQEHLADNLRSVKAGLERHLQASAEVQQAAPEGGLRVNSLSEPRVSPTRTKPVAAAAFRQQHARLAVLVAGAWLLLGLADAAGPA